MNTRITLGTFFGGDIEPGTFHGAVLASGAPGDEETSSEEQSGASSLSEDDS